MTFRNCVSAICGFFSVVEISVVRGADVVGSALKDGAVDHSGITIRMETLPAVPVIGWFSAGVLLLILSAVFFRCRKKGAVKHPLVLILVASACIVHAVDIYFATTDSSGDWSMSSVISGQYQVDASADGYYPEHREPVIIMEGMNEIPEIILYPIETPTPSETPEPTETSEPGSTPSPLPTEIPSETPADTPTESPTEIPSEIPTETPVMTETAQPTQAATATPTSPASGTLCYIDGIVGNMRCVDCTGPGGFTQGSATSEVCRDSGETQFTHILTFDIAVMETEITRQMWIDLRSGQPTLPGDPSDTGFSPGMNYPVQNVTWNEAVLFANLLSLQNGFEQCYFKDSAFTVPVDSSNYASGMFYCHWTSDGYRLPCEGEWEYFCRAGTTGPFSCPEPNYDASNCISCAGVHYTLANYCTYCGNDSYRTDPAGSRYANPWNLKDVHGNVMEWCWDWRISYPAGTQTDYRGPTGSYTYRVTRGGGWEDTADDCRSADRGVTNPPGFRGDRQGFRCVRTLGD